MEREDAVVTVRMFQEYYLQWENINDPHEKLLYKLATCTSETKRPGYSKAICHASVERMHIKEMSKSRLLQTPTTTCTTSQLLLLETTFLDVSISTITVRTKVDRAGEGLLHLNAPPLSFYELPSCCCCATAKISMDCVVLVGGKGDVSVVAVSTFVVERSCGCSLWRDVFVWNMCQVSRPRRPYSNCPDCPVVLPQGVFVL
jgi:hypothetical protein